MNLVFEPGFGESTYVSHYSAQDGLTPFPPRFPQDSRHDARDGEQQAGVVFTKTEKVEIARLLAQCGVHRIEKAIPSASRDDQEITAEIASFGLSSETWVAIRALTKDVDSGVDGLASSAWRTTCI